jgi:hypothetical protein
MSLLRGIVLGAIGAGKVQTIIAKQKNRLILKMPNEFDKNKPTDLMVNFDIVSNWGYEHSVKITENPVEQGVNINDHRIIQPSKLTLDIAVSNIPNPLNSFSNIKNVLKGVGLLFTAGFKVGETPSEATYTLLVAGMDNSEVFDIDTPTGILENYLITNIKHKNDKTNFGAFEGTIELQEIITFENQRLKTERAGINEPKKSNGTLEQAG